MRKLLRMNTLRLRLLAGFSTLLLVVLVRPLPASQAGREDWIPVKLLAGAEGYLAEPVFGKSNLIFTLSRADGLVRIPADANGLAAGEPVEVYLF